MLNETRALFNQYLSQLAVVNGVASALESFAVEPSVQQRLETRIQESSEFMRRVNNIGVIERSGEKIGLSVGTSIASTTDTTLAERVPSDPTTLLGRGYTCEQTNFDTAVRYAKLDAWAKFADFQIRLRDTIVKRQALDIMMIGFNGTSRASTSNRTANPLLQDVNVGWLEHIRQEGNYMPELPATPGKIEVGAGKTFANLDALVYAQVNERIKPWYRDDPELVAILGRELLADKYFPLINQDQRPVDQLAMPLIVSQKRIGGLQAVAAPYFPAKAILITRLDNLSRYYQIGSRRRTILDNAKRDQIENFESSNDAYVVEDYEGCVLMDHIEMVP